MFIKRYSASLAFTVLLHNDTVNWPHVVDKLLRNKTLPVKCFPLELDS